MKHDSIMETLQRMARHKDGTYVSMDLSAESREMLDRYVEQMLGLKERVDPSTYHITIIYSRTPVPTAESREGMTTDKAASVKGYEVFPTKNDGKCLVMRLDFPFANAMNAVLGTEGATSDYSEYKPHLTLAYDMEQEIDPATLPIPQFPLYFDAIKVAPLQPDYIPKNK
jgi:2'-5' RNA ligase